MIRSSHYGLTGIWLIVLLFGAKAVFCQQMPAPGKPASGSPVEIRHSDKTSFIKKDDSTSLTILVGKVDLKQGNTIFKCDSCVKNDKAKTFEAWGNVHINDSDTTNIYSQHLLYLTQKEIAYLDKNVKLTDGQVTLTTPSLEYNMDTKIATYKKGGKVVNKKTVITSKEAFYYTDIKDLDFSKDVVVKDPAYDITGDSLRYNTETRVAKFVAPTLIKDSANRTINTRDGFYNLGTGEAQFGQRSLINDNNKTTLVADNISLDNYFAKAEGNAIVVDSVRNSIIIANLIYQNRTTEAILATHHPLMILKQEGDSVYITADTLFSAKLTDLYIVSPTLAGDSIGIRRDSSFKPDTSIYKYGNNITVINGHTADSLSKDSVSLNPAIHGLNSPSANMANEPVLPTSSSVDEHNMLKDDSIKIKVDSSQSIQESALPKENSGIRNGEVSNLPGRDTIPATDSNHVLIDIPQKINDNFSITNQQPIRTVRDTISNKQNMLKPELVDKFVDSSGLQSENLSTVDSITGNPPIRSSAEMPDGKILVPVVNEDDSTNRYFEAFHHVRIYSDSMQAVSDSLFYSFKDSVFRFYQDPVVWSQGSQVTGDTIYMHTQNKKPAYFEAFKNAFIINQVAGNAFNQVKSSRLDGYFTDGNLDSVRAKGSAQCIYYVADDDSAYIGVNKADADIMDAYFVDKSLKKIVFRSQVTGDIYPIRQKSPQEMQLENFRWLESRRPKSKFELMQ